MLFRLPNGRPALAPSPPSLFNSDAISGVLEQFAAEAIGFAQQ